MCTLLFIRLDCLLDDMQHLCYFVKFFSFICVWYMAPLHGCVITDPYYSSYSSILYNDVFALFVNFFSLVWCVVVP